MLKILLKSIFILILFPNLALSEIINKIEIFGNKRISKDTILVLADLKENSNLDKEKLNSSFIKLFESNFFKDIDFKLKDNNLNISVVENPIIEEIKFSGIKNKNILKIMSERTSLKNRMSFTNNKLQNDLIIVKNILKSNGYYFADVKTLINNNNEINSVKIDFKIDLGKKAKIKKITFIGNKQIKDKKLLEVIASEEHKFWKFISNNVYVDQQRINLDQRLLENYYKNIGFYKVKILNSFASFDNDNGFFELIFNIDAGDKYYFNELNLNLPDDYEKNDFQKIFKVFKKIEGTKYSIESLNLILTEIDYIASARLYDFIDAKVEEEIIDKNKINLTFNIVDSEKVYVERVNIYGNSYTIEEVIRNKLVVDEGDPLNSLLYNKSIDNIRSLGIFKNVQSKIKDGSQADLKELDIIVEEQATGEISLAAGVGTSGSTIGAGIKKKNFLGKGINLDTNFEVSQDSLEGEFTYSRPNFAYTDNTLFTSVSSGTSDYLSDFGYKISNIQFTLGTEFEQYENLFFSPSLKLSLEDLKTNSNASRSLKKQEGAYEDFYFNYGLNYDLRDSKYRPTRGNKTSFYQDLPLISNSKEIINTFIFTQYKLLNRTSEMVGKASLYMKSANSLDGSDVRISKRPQIPYQRLRGFEKGKVGPVDSNNDFVGGNYITALNLSTEIPGVLSTIENIDFAYFVDFANVWGVDYDSSIDDSNFIRSSTGLGVNFLTPIGPLSFSLSKPITKKSTDKTETFRFNLGTTF